MRSSLKRACLRTALMSLSSVIVLGCSDSHGPPHSEVDSGLGIFDAGEPRDPIDAGVSVTDAGESGGPSDSGIDASDAPSSVHDGGVPADAQSAEDAGQPADPDSGVACADGERRLLPCQCDGAIPQLCRDGAWVSESGCVIRDRPCQPGQDESYYDFARCQTRTRQCTGECFWGAWVAMGDPPECYRGSAPTCSPETGESCVCNNECRCEPDPECQPSSM